MAQVVRKCTGYRFFVQGGVLYFLLLLTTILLANVAPLLSIWLLLHKCPLDKAVFVRVKVTNVVLLDICVAAIQLEAALRLVSAAAAQWQAASGQDQDTVVRTPDQAATGELTVWLPSILVSWLVIASL